MLNDKCLVTCCSRRTLACMKHIIMYHTRYAVYEQWHTHHTYIYIHIYKTYIRRL